MRKLFGILFCVMVTPIFIVASCLLAVIFTADNLMQMIKYIINNKENNDDND